MAGARLLLGLGTALLLLQGSGAGVAAQSGESLRLPAGDVTGCGGIAGRFVAFVAADGALVVLAAQPVPGGQTLPGEDAPPAVTVSVPGVGPLDLGSAGPVYGLVDRRFGGAGRRACVAFDKQSFTWTSDLLTYVHWLFRDILFRLPGASPDAHALRIGERRVTIEVTPEGFSPIQLEMTEAGTTGLTLTGSQTPYLFSSFVLADDPAGAEVAVKVLDPGGPVFGGTTGRELAFVRATASQPAVTPTVPSFSIRLLGIGPDRYTIRPTEG